MDKKRVLIVDDSAYVRQVLKEILSRHSDIEVVAVAVNGVDAIDKTLRYNPDIITLDLEMPVMDGFAFLRWLMMERPTPVIVVSSQSADDVVFKALGLGAIDFVLKPTRRASSRLKEVEGDLIEKIRQIDRDSLVRLKRNLVMEEVEPPQTEVPAGLIDSVIAIGASTGGPQAVEYILRNIGLVPIPILVAIHMPGGYTRLYADRVNSMSPVKVKEAEQGEPLRPYTAYICPGGYHLEITDRAGEYRISLKRPRSDDRYVPSIDRLLFSVAEHFKNRAIGVILTGMGSDGKRGIMKIFSEGGYTIAESEDSAVVYGMPKEARETGSVRAVLSLKRIPDELTKIIRST